jgi:SAM-dependent methyltransferase
MEQLPPNRYSLYAEALRDYYNQLPDRPALYLVREDGFSSELPVELFFSEFKSFSILEKRAIECITGNVLDVGSGAGRHTLELMQRDISVTALDIDSLLIKIMIDRGVKHAVVSDIFRYVPAEKYEFILLLMHGLGIGGNLDGLNRLLSHLATMLKDGGRIIADSLDVSKTEENVHLEYQSMIGKSGRYKGEIRMYMEYGGRKSELIEWLHVDFDTLTGIAEKAGLRSILVESCETGEYLAELIPKRMKTLMAM